MGVFSRLFSFFRATEPPIAIDLRPADGRVDVLLLPSLRGEANPFDARFRRFLAVERADGTPTPRPRRSRRLPSLRGKVAFFSLFIGRDGRPWTDKEIAHAHAAIIRAGEWIERQALRWNAPVNIELSDTYFAGDDPVIEEQVVLALDEYGGDDPLFEVGTADKDLASASRAAAGLGFRDVADLIETAEAGTVADRRVWLIHLRRAGRSCAVAADEAPIPGMSAAICYAREENFAEPLAGPPFSDPVTFVHEVLHLFGATDKYGPPLHTFPRGLVTERDVMRLDFESLSRIRVDPATAIEIGWATPGTPAPGNDDARRAR